MACASPLLASALVVHTAIEERHLYPVFRQNALPEAERESIQEHEQVRQRLRALMAMRQDDPRLAPVLGDLDRSVRAHVAKEEGELFPWLKARIDDAQLEGLGEAMQSMSDVLMEQEDLFAEAERFEHAEHGGAAHGP